MLINPPKTWIWQDMTSPWPDPEPNPNPGGPKES